MNTRRSFLALGAGTAAAVSVAWNMGSAPFFELKNVSLAQLRSFRIVKESATILEAKVSTDDFIKYVQAGGSIADGPVKASGNVLKYQEAGKTVNLSLA